MKNNMILLISFFSVLLSCQKDDISYSDARDYKEEMRKFVIGISQYAKSKNPAFNIIPQNGIELVSSNGDASGNPHISYLNAIDANGQEDLFFGYDEDNVATDNKHNSYLRELLNISKKAGNVILVTDYCSDPSKMENSYLQNRNSGYVSFAANERELNNIPAFPNPIYQENANTVTEISQAKNFLYLINPSKFNSKSEFIKAVTSKNYDLLIMDLFFTDGMAFSKTEINQLKNKANGGKRLVISYMSIGEAENYRYYWKENWSSTRPEWLDAENPNWKGNFKVKYWNADWQNIIYGNDNSYLKKIIDANFDGVYLDIIDAFEFYEN
ncbi:endo alpha-1,4 polygalactosaminidase [Flavobacterium defluvii]|uniref:Glycoside-hydrolase family GH114 TIM-barrel domain-containing protein n=1 Tax=Flavobacterium defluvii TaxID=370979 RepID=A0A1M5V4X6_9FLAO|nr:endo alpha-1,4 polygalactosaminidase [Flavobacterium defluvii]SHH70275.1 cysteinyl-tRNA synthetase, unknown class [Flavobacterium defluvii]